MATREGVSVMDGESLGQSVRPEVPSPQQTVPAGKREQSRKRNREVETPPKEDSTSGGTKHRRLVLSSDSKAQTASSSADERRLVLVPSESPKAESVSVNAGQPRRPHNSTSRLVKSITDLIEHLKMKRDFVLSVGDEIVPKRRSLGDVFQLHRAVRRIGLFRSSESHDVLIRNCTRMPSDICAIVYGYLHLPTPPQRLMRVDEIAEGALIEVRRDDGFWCSARVAEVKDGKFLAAPAEGPVGKDWGVPSDMWIPLSDGFRFARHQHFKPRRCELGDHPYKVNDDVKVWRFKPTPRRWVPGTVTGVHPSGQVEVTYFYRKIMAMCCWFHAHSCEIQPYTP